MLKINKVINIGNNPKAMPKHIKNKKRINVVFLYYFITF